MLHSLYAIDKSYEDNLKQGPTYSFPLPKRPPSYTPSYILGKSLASPLGIPAGPLLNSEWISLAGKLGYDILTYKTIRSQPTASHPLPNVLFVNTEEKQLEKEDTGKTLYTTNHPPKALSDIAITNSFGMPSMSLDYLKEDLPKARNSLKDSQLFVVSITGSHYKEKTYKDDLVFLASFAKDYGAEAIEVNFSCPNVFEGEGALYLDPGAVYTLSKAIAKAITPLPLIIKVGVFPTPDQLEATLIAAAKAEVQVVCGINTLSMQVKKENGEAALSPERLNSGICGNPIRTLGMEFVHLSSKIIKNKNLNLSIWGKGLFLEYVICLCG